MKRSLNFVLIFTFFVLFFEGLLSAQTAAQIPSSSPQAETPATAPGQGNVMIEELKTSPNAGTRAKAARELGRARDTTSIPALTEALSDPSEKVQREVILALAQIHTAETLDALIKATQDSNEENSLLAVESLVGYYTGIVPSPGFSGFVKKNWQRAKGHFTPDTMRINPGVFVEPKVIAALVATLKSARSIHASAEAAKGLGTLVARAAVPDLVKSAHSSDETLSLESLNALSKIKEKTAGPQLIDLLDSPNEEIKQQACSTIGILRTGEAASKLQSIFANDTNPKSKEKALEGLAYLGTAASVPEFTTALGSDDKLMRTSAAEGLARAGDPKAIPELEKTLAVEKDADTRLAIYFALTALGKLDHLNDLVDGLSSRTRGDVAQTYLVELARAPGFLAKLYPNLQNPNAAVRKRLCIVLMYSGDQSTLDQLDRLSHDPDGDVAAQALQAKEGLRARLAAAGTGPKASTP